MEGYFKVAGEDAESKTAKAVIRQIQIRHFNTFLKKDQKKIKTWMINQINPLEQGSTENAGFRLP